jgi:hypothetical protein
MNVEERKFTVEEVDAVTPAARARVDLDGRDARPTSWSASATISKASLRKSLRALSGEPGGDLYEAVIAALKEIFDPEIPVNIYELGLIYGVDITPEGRSRSP